jgi:hypothetical protein
MYEPRYRSEVISKKNTRFVSYQLHCIDARIISYVPVVSGARKLVICLATRISLVITFRLQEQ